MASKKYLTVSEAASAKDKAAQLMRNLGNDDKASEFDDMSPEEYAEHKGINIVQQNPYRKDYMKTSKSKVELQEELDEAHDYIDELENKLDQIAGIADDDDTGDEDEDSGEDDEVDEDEEEDEDDGDEAEYLTLRQ